MDAVAKTAAVTKELVAQLENLRSVAKETSRAHLSNLERDIVDLIELVEGLEARKRKKKRSKEIESAKEVLDGLKLRPEKGRRKDLRRIEEAVKAMAKLVSDLK